jgi:hypothetical protein
MALRVIDGVPGSGKTFYAVDHLAKNYFKKTQDGSYKLVRECTIITNIDGFVPDHLDLNKEMEAAGGVKEFFAYDYQEKYKEGKPPIVYVVDEAQRFFRKGDRNLKDVYTYFEYHRHWGQDIYLVTQNVKKLPPDITYLPEYLIKSLPRVRSIGNGFKYHWVASGEVIKKETRSKDQGVFALYKSMDTAEQEKISNPMLKTIGLFFLTSLLVCGGGYMYFVKRADRGDISASASSAVPVPASSAALGNSFIPVGEPVFVEPEPSYVVFLPLNSITGKRGGRVTTLYVWRGHLLTAGEIPHTTVYRGGRLYVILDYVFFQFIFSQDDMPSDFIVQEIEPGTRRERSEKTERSGAT